MKKILILEDEEGFRRSLARHLRSGRKAEIIEAGTCAEALQQIAEHVFDLVVIDVALPDGLGFSVMEAVPAGTHVIVMTGQAVLDHAITALRSGADDFLEKPFSMEALDSAIDRIVGRRELHSTRPGNPDDVQRWRDTHAPELIGEDPTLLRTFDIIRRVADTDCSVLITGETGTGKELVAQAIHRASSRHNGNYVAVNCAAIPENLMESELFGHAKGAFTGATSAHKGRFVVAHQGTLLLDEIGEMSMQLQAKLLRVLQESEVRAVGENRAQKIDVRVIAATHRDIEDMAESGAFREDLLYRLDVIRIELPALRERPGDIPLLARNFLVEVAERRGRQIEGMDDEAMAALINYRWPGNVRQLRHTVERMVVLGSDGMLGLNDVPARIRKAKPHKAAGPGDNPVLPDAGIDLRDAVVQFENALIRQALERTGWNKNKAANILQMNRTTLVEKLKKRGWENKESSWAG